MSILTGSEEIERQRKRHRRMEARMTAQLEDERQRLDVAQAQAQAARKELTRLQGRHWRNVWSLLNGGKAEEIKRTQNKLSSAESRIARYQREIEYIQKKLVTAHRRLEELPAETEPTPPSILDQAGTTVTPRKEPSILDKGGGSRRKRPAPEQMTPVQRQLLLDEIAEDTKNLIRLLTLLRVSSKLGVAGTLWELSHQVGVVTPGSAESWATSAAAMELRLLRLADRIDRSLPGLANRIRGSFTEFQTAREQTREASDQLQALQAKLLLVPDLRQDRVLLAQEKELRDDIFGRFLREAGRSRASGSVSFVQFLAQIDDMDGKLRTLLGEIERRRRPLSEPT